MLVQNTMPVFLSLSVSVSVSMSMSASVSMLVCVSVFVSVPVPVSAATSEAASIYTHTQARVVEMLVLMHRVGRGMQTWRTPRVSFPKTPVGWFVGRVGG